MHIKVAINGLGRIGRLALRNIIDQYPNLEVVALNDLTDIDTIAHLVKYDSAYGIYDPELTVKENELLVKDQAIKVFQEADPEKLPWGELVVDVVLECTGVFTDYAGAHKHILAGAKKVLISAPAKSENVPMFVLGVNEDKYNPETDNIVSMASCTTNCLAPVLKVLHDNFRVVKGVMTTVHSYTNDQRILDLAHRDLRRARAAAVNIIPTTTGAAASIGKVIPELEGKLDGIALRVPTPTVSLVDLVCTVEEKVSAAEVNEAFKKASQTSLTGILGVEDSSLVSSDFKGNPLSAVIDSSLTMVEEDLVKVIAWYDNEWAYACKLVEFTSKLY